MLIEKKVDAEFELNFAAAYESKYKKTVETECSNKCSEDKKCYNDCCESRKGEIKKDYEKDWKKEKREEYKVEKKQDKKKLKYKKKTDKKLKYDLDLNEDGAAMVVNSDIDIEGNYKFKLSIKRVCEYRPDDVEGFQVNGNDEILNMYGAGLAELSAEANFKLNNWNFTEFETSDIQVNGTRDNELRASTRDGIFTLIFRVNPSPATLDGNVPLDLNDLKFDFAVDVLKLRESGWFKESNTELAIIASLESKMKHRLCEDEAESGAVCIEREDEVSGDVALSGYIQWVKRMVCAQGASADLRIKSTTLIDGNLPLFFLSTVAHCTRR